jgi:hypothetical protein
MIYLVSILIILLLSSGYANFNLYRKYSQLEETAMDNQNFIFSMRNRVLSHKSYLRQLDRNGSFESDDEVGFFFKELKQIINDISVYLDVNDDVDEEEQTPKNIRSQITRL